MTATRVALAEIDRAYFEGVSYEMLSQRIVAAAHVLAAADRSDPLRHDCELFAPLLWGAPSGTAIDPADVQAAIERPEGARHVTAWANAARVLTARRDAA